jgi:hypothetical protein
MLLAMNIFKIVKSDASDQGWGAVLKQLRQGKKIQMNKLYNFLQGHGLTVKRTMQQ